MRKSKKVVIGVVEHQCYNFQDLYGQVNVGNFDVRLTPIPNFGDVGLAKRGDFFDIIINPCIPDHDIHRARHQVNVNDHPTHYTNPNCTVVNNARYRKDKINTLISEATTYVLLDECKGGFQTPIDPIDFKRVLRRYIRSVLFALSDKVKSEYEETKVQQPKKRRKPKAKNAKGEILLNTNLEEPQESDGSFEPIREVLLGYSVNDIEKFIIGSEIAGSSINDIPLLINRSDVWEYVIKPTTGAMSESIMPINGNDIIAFVAGRVYSEITHRDAPDNTTRMNYPSFDKEEGGFTVSDVERIANSSLKARWINFNRNHSDFIIERFLPDIENEYRLIVTPNLSIYATRRDRVGMDVDGHEQFHIPDLNTIRGRDRHQTRLWVRDGVKVDCPDVCTLGHHHPGLINQLIRTLRHIKDNSEWVFGSVDIAISEKHGLHIFEFSNEWGTEIYRINEYLAIHKHILDDLIREHME